MHALSKIGLKSFLILLLGFFGAVSESLAAVDWPHVVLQPVGQTLSILSPTQVTNAGDGSGRLFVVERAGMVRSLVPPQGDQSTFLDIRDRVLTNTGEQGLLGLAFAPDFKTSGAFYVNYTRKPDGATVVSRFSLSQQGSGLPSSEKILLTIPHDGGYHNGGQIAFGPDGCLYIGTGDGGLNNLTAQDPASLLGKILRIKPTTGSAYVVPADNPLKNTQGARPEIWLSGCRNPWRFSFDRETGELYIADVGEYRWEEIDVLAPGESGKNLGWPYFEGDATYVTPSPNPASFFRFPAITIGRDSASAVTGGYVYRGAAPAADQRMRGAYFFADWAHGRIFAAVKRDGQWFHQQIAEAHINPTSFGESESGDLYVVSEGALFKVDPSGKTHNPEISLRDGTYATDQTAQVSCLSTDARIHYTAESREPTETDPFLSSGDSLPINGTKTLRFKAFKSGFLPSETVEKKYVLNAGEPILSKFGGTFDRDQTVIFTTSNGAGNIHYTTDGSAPTTASPFFASGGSLFIDRDTTLKVRTFNGEYTPSSVVQATFSFKVGPAYLSFSGMVKSGTVVHLVPSSTPDATVYYTLDGSLPTASSPVVPGSLTITESAKIIVRAINGRYTDSDAYLHWFGITEYAEGYVSLRYAGGTDSGFADGPRRAARFSEIGDICADTIGNIFIADTQNHRIRKIDPAGNVSTFAGIGAPASVNGPRAAASFLSPSGICLDSTGNLYVAESAKLRRIEPSGEVTTCASLPFSYEYHLAAAPDGKIYIGYSSGNDGAILRFTPGQSTAVEFASENRISSFPEVAVDSGGNVYVTMDAGFLKYAPDGSSEKYAGEDYSYYELRGDGPLQKASFGRPRGLVFDSKGALYFADRNSVRVIHDGTVRTIVGGSHASASEGYGSLATVWAEDLCIGANGQIYASRGGEIFAISQSGDEDEDGVPDSLEKDRGPYAVGQNDALIDTDGDGLDNASELALGTDPESFDATRPQLELRWNGNRYSDIGWRGSAFAKQEIYYSTDLLSWKELQIGQYGADKHWAGLPFDLEAENRVFFKAVTRPLTGGKTPP